MFRACRSVAMALVVASLSVIPASGITMSAASSPTVRIVPRAVPIGGKATLMGDHFPAGKFFTLLLVVPGRSKTPVRALVPRLAQADSKGSIVLHFRMPIVTRCGAAWMYVFAAKSKIQVRTPVTLTRCTAPPGQKIPPPPPKP